MCKIFPEGNNRSTIPAVAEKPVNASESPWLEYTGYSGSFTYPNIPKNNQQTNVVSFSTSRAAALEAWSASQSADIWFINHGLLILTILFRICRISLHSLYWLCTSACWAILLLIYNLIIYKRSNLTWSLHEWRLKLETIITRRLVSLDKEACKFSTMFSTYNA